MYGVFGRDNRPSTINDFQPALQAGLCNAWVYVFDGDPTAVTANLVQIVDQIVDQCLLQQSVNQIVGRKEALTNERDVLANLSATIADMYSNIEHVNLTEKDGRISTIEFIVTVNECRHKFGNKRDILYTFSTRDLLCNYPGRM